MNQLPNIMVAPNGARLKKEDHPSLPITIEEIVRAAKECYGEGAEGLHLHLRNEQGNHILDAGLYNEAIRELSIQVPQMRIQITTEAVGIYTPEHQKKVALESNAKMVSVAIREITQEDEGMASGLFGELHARGVAVQHILYDEEDVRLLAEIFGCNETQPNLQVLFVLGKYGTNIDSNPKSVGVFLGAMKRNNLEADWMICAFGQTETQCLVEAKKMGGKVRVGFENNTVNNNGEVASNNAQRVREVVQMIRTSGGKWR